MTDLKISVEGVKELRKALKQVEDGSQKELRKAWNKAAEIVVADAAPRVPKLSGRAQDSLRARSTQTEGRVVGGSARAPYYPWLDFGGRVGRNKSVVRPFKREGRYIYPAIRRNRARIVDVAEQEVRDVIRKAGLS